MTKELINHIKENLKKGYTKETMKYALIKQGYQRVTIERTIEKAEKELAKESSQEKTEKKEKPKIRYELYDKDNKIVQVYDSSKKESWLKRFFNKFFNKK